MKTIITHSANFHPDDVFGVATLIYMLELQGFSLKSKNKDKKIKVVRSLEPWKIKDVDYVLDIGMKYDPKKGWFDHHQEGGAGERQNGIKYASFGLIWKQFGKKLAGSEYGADWIDRHIVQAIDAMDNGQYVYKSNFDDVHPFLFESYIDTVCDLVKGVAVGNYKKTGDNLQKEKEFYIEFMRMVELAKDVVRVFIIKAKQKEKIAKEAKKVYDAAKDKRILISEKFVPSDFAEFKAPNYVQPLVYAFHHLRGGWAAKVIRKGGQTFDSYISFPKKWRGKRDEEMAKVTGVPDAVFCHNSGFLIVAKSREGLMELIQKAFKELKIK